LAAAIGASEDGAREKGCTDNHCSKYWKLLIDLSHLSRWCIAIKEFKPFWLLWFWLISHG
jgi:hypothetical protein